MRAEARARGQSCTARVPSVLHALAALLGTLPIALLASLALARYLPVPLETRFVLGFSLCLPLWLAAISFAWVSKRPGAVWLCALLALLGLWVVE